MFGGSWKTTESVSLSHVTTKGYLTGSISQSHIMQPVISGKRAVSHQVPTRQSELSDFPPSKNCNSLLQWKRLSKIDREWTCSGEETNKFCSGQQIKYNLTAQTPLLQPFWFEWTWQHDSHCSLFAATWFSASSPLVERSFEPKQGNVRAYFT